MVFKELFQNAQHLIKEISHFGRLGKVASRRSFLKRERKKFLLKLGERAMHFIHNGQIKIPELKSLSQDLDKIEALLANHDYGGKHGIVFNKARSPSSKAGAKR